MAQIIISKKAGRRIKLVFFLILSVLLVTICVKRFGHLPRATHLTGWLLLSLMLILALYNGRKKIPFLPLATSKGWLQFHIYAGFFTLLLFLGHLHFRLPTGGVECTLAVLYSLVMVSGFVGLFISRSFPKRLTSRGGEVIFEKIPIIRRDFREKAEALALKSIPEAQASTLADFYVSELSDFFSGAQNFWTHLLENRGPLNRLLKKIEDVSRFLNEKERAVMIQIAELVRQKDGLDYHRTLQLTLKLWLFVHIPLTYSLLILSFVHLVLVYAFSGGTG
ncbi:MAG: hypothetical protein JWM68_2137 [Verrucomicrobiales bacterium]|nr:hypothetical protein [Verrucomicrobiales bacterium]